MMEKLRRLTPAPLIMRAVVFGAALTCLLTATPGKALSLQVIGFFVGVSLVPALLPNSRFVDAVMLLTVLIWVAGTVSFGQQVTGLGAFATACALYLLHAAAALAAVLPNDAIVDSAVVFRWAARSAMVIGSAGVVTLLIVFMAPTGLESGSSELLVLAGLAAAAGVIAILAWAAKLKREA